MIIIIIYYKELIQISEKPDIFESLKEYYFLENTYIGLIKKQQFGSIITTNKLYSLINQHFYDSNNPQIISDRRIAEK